MQWQLTPKRMIPKSLPRMQICALSLATLSGLLFLFPAGHEAVRATQNIGQAALTTGTGPSGPAQADVYRQEAEEIRREIKIQEKKLDSVARQETSIISELDNVEQQIQRLRRKTERLDAEVKALGRQLGSAEEATADLENRISANENYLSQRLVAWSKLNRVGQIHLLASAENIVVFLKRKDALERILTHDDRVRQKLLDYQGELKLLKERLAADRREKQKRVSEKEHQLALLSKNVNSRADLLAKVRERKDLQLSALKELKRSANELNRKFAAINRQQPSIEPVTGAALKPFSDFKGLLKMPVEGNIINLFGPYRNTQFNVTNFRSGIDIKTDKGEPVRAVYTGNVLYASWFKGYGNMMIIDHGANYYTVYAHVEEMFKSTGDRVEAGDVIATVGDTGSMSGARLYFEIRHHGKPVDPVEWLK